MQEKSGRPGDAVWDVDVYLRPFAHTFSHVAHAMTTTLRGRVGGDTQPYVSNCVRLHHKIDQVFLAYIEKHGKAWVQG